MQNVRYDLIQVNETCSILTFHFGLAVKSHF